MNQATKEISSEDIINILYDASFSFTIMSDRVVINSLNSICHIRFKNVVDGIVVKVGYVIVEYCDIDYRCNSSIELNSTIKNILKMDKAIRPNGED